MRVSVRVREAVRAALTAVAVSVLDPDGAGEPGHTSGSKAADHHGKHFGTHLNVPGNQSLSLSLSPCPGLLTTASAISDPTSARHLPRLS